MNHCGVFLDNVVDRCAQQVDLCHDCIQFGFKCALQALCSHHNFSQWGLLGRHCPLICIYSCLLSWQPDWVTPCTESIGWYGKYQWLHLCGGHISEKCVREYWACVVGNQQPSCKGRVVCCPVRAALTIKSKMHLLNFYLSRCSFSHHQKRNCSAKKVEDISIVL